MIDLCCRTCNKSINGNFIFKLERCLILSSLEQISINCTWCQLAFSVWSQHRETPQAPQIERERGRIRQRDSFKDWCARNSAEFVCFKQFSVQIMLVNWFTNFKLVCHTTSFHNHIGCTEKRHWRQRERERKDFSQS